MWRSGSRNGLRFPVPAADRTDTALAAERSFAGSSGASARPRAAAGDSRRSRLGRPRWSRISSVFALVRGELPHDERLRRRARPAQHSAAALVDMSTSTVDPCDHTGAGELGFASRGVDTDDELGVAAFRAAPPRAPASSIPTDGGRHWRRPHAAATTRSRDSSRRCSHHLGGGPLVVSQRASSMRCHGARCLRCATGPSQSVRPSRRGASCRRAGHDATADRSSSRGRA